MPDDALPGKLKILPPEEVIDRLRQDYYRGTSRMIFSDAPKFDDLVEGLHKLEKAINSG